MSTKKKLSLYKLFLNTTTWVSTTCDEHNRILTWLNLNRSLTNKRNSIDNLFETFLWFPTDAHDNIWVPLGHLARLFDQIDARIPTNAPASHPNALLRDDLRGCRSECGGNDILQLRLSSWRGQGGQ